MSSPGTLRFGQIAVTPSPPPVGYDLIYVKTDDVLYIQDSAGIEVALGSASSITSLSGEATGTGPGNAVVTLSNSAVIGKVLTGFTPGPNSPVLATDTILQAFQKLQAQFNATAGTAITSLTGDVSATGPGAAAATVNSVGGKSAAAIAQSVTDTQAATSANTASTIIKRDASGNFSSNIVTADLNGNATTATTSTNFSGSLSGDVTGTQSATVVAFVGTKSAADIQQSVTDTQAATSVNTSSTIVKRDASGNFSAGTITAALTGNVTGNVSGSSSTFTGSLSGDVTGTQSSTAISSPTVTGKLLTGYVTGTNTPIVATDSILTAFENLQAQVSGSVGSAITSLTGDVTATGPGSAAATVVSVGGSSAANINSAELAANAATSTNTPSTIVKRDASGDFSAGIITASLNGNATTSTTSINVTGVVAILNGGTGQTTANAGFDALSPMSTLGDIIYEDATPTAARLPGNITTTKKFLSQTGTGTISAVPAWSTLVSGDIPNNAANTTGTAGNITATTNSTLTTLTALTLPATQLSGTLQAAQEPAHTGDVTNTAGSLNLSLVATTNSTLTTLPALTSASSLSTVGTITSGTWNGTTIAINHGGTGQTTQAAAFDALSPTTTKGDLIVHDTSTNVRLPVGTNGQVLTADSTQATGLSYTTPTTGTVTSVALATPGVLYTVTGSPVTTSGTLTLNLNTQSANTVFAGPTTGGAATPTFRALVSADIPPINLASTSNGGVTGVLPIANGGTNSSTTLNNNRIMVSSGGAIVEAAALTNGQVLIGSTGSAPVAGTITAGTGITITNAAGSITVAQTGLNTQVTKTANYTILSTDSIIFCDTSGGAFTLTLPSPAALAGKIYRIIDTTGFFNTNNLTLARSSTEKIEGLAASKVLQTNWGWFEVTTNSTDWFVG